MLFNELLNRLSILQFTGSVGINWYPLRCINHLDSILWKHVEPIVFINQVISNHSSMKYRWLKGINDACHTKFEYDYDHDMAIMWRRHYCR